MPNPTYPKFDSKNPEKSFNTLIRHLELRDSFNREGNPRSTSGDQIKAKTVQSINIADNAITNDQLAVGAISTSIIASAAVDNSNLANNAVTTSIIADGAVTSTKIYTAAVNSSALATSAVSFINMQSSAVYGAVLAPAAVSNGHLQTSVVHKKNINFPVQYTFGPSTAYNVGSSISPVGTIFGSYNWLIYSPDTVVSVNSALYSSLYGQSYFLVPQNGRIKSSAVIEYLDPRFSVGTSSSDNTYSSILLKNNVSVAEFIVQPSIVAGDLKKGLAISTVGVSVAQGDILSVVYRMDSRASIDTNVPGKIFNTWINLELD